ncbi:class I SAM-dependent methyltransferase [Halalkalicoccus tibetensis]|uniref:Class I SAM-dependent methyltransferase n=1 Tax=Halalkalicoccus tibetensis TaxID=175632 RepID=A0ABD5V609_9EURY
MTEFRNTAQPDRDWWDTLWPGPRDTLESLGTGDCGSLVDICCGDGHFTVPAADLVSGPVYGVDLDPELLEALEARLETERIETVEGDAMALPDLLPEPVGCALLANTLHGVPEKRALAEAVAAVLEPDGRFVVINWVDAPPEETWVLDEPRGPPAELRMTPKETVEAIEPAGFDARETVSVSPHHYAVTFDLSAHRG